MDALPELLLNGTTSHPLLRMISLARMVNTQSGGVVIAPWEVESLDESWLDGFRFLENDLQDGLKARKKIESVKERWLRQHPTYGKH